MRGNIRKTKPGTTPRERKTGNLSYFIWMRFGKLLQLLLFVCGGAGSLKLLIDGFHLHVQFPLVVAILVFLGIVFELGGSFPKVRSLLILAGIILYLAVGFFCRGILVRGGADLYNSALTIAREIFVTDLMPVKNLGAAPWEAAFTLCYGYTPLLIALFEGISRNRSLTWAILASCWPLLILCYFDLTPGTLGLLGMLFCYVGTLVLGGEREYKAKVQAGAVALLVGACVYFLSGLALPYTAKLFAGRETIREEIMNVGLLNWLQRKNPFAENGMSNGDLNHSKVEETSDQAVMTIVLSEQPTEALYLRGFIGQTYNGSSWSKNEEEDPDEIYRMMYDQAFELGTSLGVKDGRTAFVDLYDEAMDCKLYLSEGRGETRYSYYTLGEYQLFLYNTNERFNDLDYEEYVDTHYRSFPVSEKKLQRLMEQNPVYSIEEAWDFVVEYLAQNATYTLKPKAADVGEDFVEHFLFDSKEGYCVHFASAAALMFRMCGVASRYVTGYIALPEEFVRQEDGTWMAKITEETAHAWCEIYEEGAGWMLVEATPGYAEALAPLDLTPQEKIALPENGGNDSKDKENAAEEREEEKESDSKDTEPQTEEPQEETVAEQLKSNVILLVIVLNISLILLVLLLRSLTKRVKKIRSMLSVKKSMRAWDTLVANEKERNDTVLEISDRLYELFLFAGLSAALSRTNEKFALDVEEQFAFLEKGSFVPVWRTVLKAGYSGKAVSLEEARAVLAFYDSFCVTVGSSILEKEGKLRYEDFKDRQFLR